MSGEASPGFGSLLWEEFSPAPELALMNVHFSMSDLFWQHEILYHTLVGSWLMNKRKFKVNMRKLCSNLTPLPLLTSNPYASGVGKGLCLVLLGGDPELYDLTSQHSSLAQ